MVSMEYMRGRYDRALAVVRGRNDANGPSWDLQRLVDAVFQAVGGSGPWDVDEAKIVARALHAGLEPHELAHVPRVIAEMVRRCASDVEQRGALANPPRFSQWGLMLDATIWAATGTFPEGQVFDV